MLARPSGGDERPMRGSCQRGLRRVRRGRHRRCHHSPCRCPRRVAVRAPTKIEGRTVSCGNIPWRGPHDHCAPRPHATGHRRAAVSRSQRRSRMRTPEHRRSPAPAPAPSRCGITRSARCRRRRVLRGAPEARVVAGVPPPVVAGPVTTLGQHGPVAGSPRADRERPTSAARCCGGAGSAHISAGVVAVQVRGPNRSDLRRCWFRLVPVGERLGF